MNSEFVNLTPENLETEPLCCIVRAKPHPGVDAKRRWLAQRLAEGMEALGIPFSTPPVSNQLFVILQNETVARLQELGYEFETDHEVDPAHTCIRLVTSWATPDQAVEDFLRDLKGIL